MAHIAAAVAKLSGGEFTFCADVPAFIRVERAFASKFDVIVAGYFVSKLTLEEELKFAACCVPAGAVATADVNKTAEAIMGAMGPVDDLKELRRALDETLAACLPPKQPDTETNGEGGGDASEIPSRTT